VLAVSDGKADDHCTSTGLAGRGGSWGLPSAQRTGRGARVTASLALPSAVAVVSRGGRRPGLLAAAGLLLAKCLPAVFETVNDPICKGK